MDEKIKGIIGYSLIILGIIGVLLPIIPGTPFIIAGLIMLINKKMKKNI